jgi:hypothetical protein
MVLKINMLRGLGPTPVPNACILISILVLLFSCRSGQIGGEFEKYDPAKTYKLNLNPTPGSSYQYDISNETETELSIDGNKTENVNKAEMEILYRVDRDTASNLVFSMQYNKIHLYTKNGETETESDADNISLAGSQADRILSILKKGKIVATMSPSGDLKSVSGYKEIGDEIAAGFDPNDQNKHVAQNQWEKVIGEGLIKKSLDQLFKIFPDSAVHLGARWKLNTIQGGEFEMRIFSDYKLQAVNSKIAIIESEGKIVSNNSAKAAKPGEPEVITNLKGEQEGLFEMEKETGMLLRCSIKATIEGTVTVMGKEVPLKIKSLVKMNGRRLDKEK